MTHALTANLGQGHFHTAFFADDALILHPLVFAAQALIVLYGTKNARAEQTIALRLEGTIVDGFRLFDFAERPGENLLRRCNTDPDLFKGQWLTCRIENVHDLMVHVIPQFLVRGRGCFPLFGVSGFQRKLPDWPDAGGFHIRAGVLAPARSFRLVTLYSADLR